MNKLSIAIIGYGKMGKEVEKYAIEKGHQIACSIDNENEWQEKADKLKSANVAIEFSTPDAVIDNIKKCFALNLPVVTGTTGWHDQLEEISALCKEKNQALFYASNFSLGVNILFELNRKLAEMLNDFDDYNLEIEETHHTQKLDAPSGTAISLANDVLSRINRYGGWKLADQNMSESDIPIKAIRKENVFGIHKVLYESSIDTISISHSAQSRLGFVKGAVMAAEWILNKKGTFTMQNMLNL